MKKFVMPYSYEGDYPNVMVGEAESIEQFSIQMLKHFSDGMTESDTEFDEETEEDVEVERSISENLINRFNEGESLDDLMDEIGVYTGNVVEV